MHPDEEKSQPVKMQPTAEAIVIQAEKCQELTDRALRYTRYLAELIARGDGGRETALAITKLEESQHRLSDTMCILKQKAQ